MMARGGLAALIAVAAVMISCASVYDYHYRAKESEVAAVDDVVRKIAGALEPRGFAKLALASDEVGPQSGAAGYFGCQGARDLVVFSRETNGRTSVHLYECAAEVRIVTLADSWTRGEPESTDALLRHLFASELVSGRVTRVHRHRRSLE